MTGTDTTRRSSVTGRMRERYKLGADKEEEEDADKLLKVLNSQEADLILAAELGSALLERNEELSRRKEELVVEYSRKLEVGSTSIEYRVQSCFVLLLV